MGKNRCPVGSLLPMSSFVQLCEPESIFPMGRNRLIVAACRTRCVSTVLRHREG